MLLSASTNVRVCTSASHYPIDTTLKQLQRATKPLPAPALYSWHCPTVIELNQQGAISGLSDVGRGAFTLDPLISAALDGCANVMKGLISSAFWCLFPRGPLKCRQFAREAVARASERRVFHCGLASELGCAQEMGAGPMFSSFPQVGRP